MKKLYMEYFKISDDSKITDKAMLGRVISAVVVVLVCVAVMSITAFAYFTSDASSSVMPITSASFDIDVTIKNSSGTVVEVKSVSAFNYEAALVSNETYTITIAHRGTGSTGYCVVNFDGTDRFTDQLFFNGGQPTSISFTLTLAEATKVTFKANWGTSSVYADVMANNPPKNYIADQSVIDLVPKAQTPTSQPENNETPDSSDESGDEVASENQDENNQQSEE